MIGRTYFSDCQVAYFLAFIEVSYITNSYGNVTDNPYTYIPYRHRVGVLSELSLRPQYSVLEAYAGAVGKLLKSGQGQDKRPKRVRDKMKSKIALQNYFRKAKYRNICKSLVMN